MPPPFFSLQDFETYSHLVSTPYNNEDPSHQQHRDFMVNNLGAKVKYWANLVVNALPDFSKVYNGNFTNQAGIPGIGGGQVFKKYVWAMISTPTGHDAGIYFTVEINGATGQLKYKLDYDYRADRNPSDERKQQLEKSYNRADLARLISPAQLSNFTWDRLITETVNFIQEHQNLFDTWVNFAADTALTENLPRPNLVRQDPPPQRPGGNDPAPEYNPSGRGKTNDFDEQHRQNSELGDRGEGLVVQYEKDQLIAAGYHELAESVHAFDTDGEGYDIESFYPEDGGHKKYIEVKTTTGPVGTPFYVTRNELFQAQRLHPNYSLYRLYNYNKDQGTANFYEDPNFGVREEDYQLVPVTFLAYRR